MMNECYYLPLKVSLGILDENENTNEGMLKIMKHLHTYVAEDKSGALLRMFAVGDLT